jgi:hypothetical protein
MPPQDWYLAQVLQYFLSRLQACIDQMAAAVAPDGLAVQVPDDISPNKHKSKVHNKINIHYMHIH